MAKGKKQTEEKPNRKAKQNLYDVIVKPNIEKVKDWYRNGATEEEVAKKLGISLRSLHNYKTRYPEFLEAVSKSRDIADAEVEAALFKRAIGYKYTEITKERIIDKSQKARHEQGEFELTEADWEFAIDYFNDECCYCGSKRELTKDHIVPLSKGGRFSRENIIPCCRVCNSSKNDSEFIKWYKNQKFYNEYKEQKIKDYIQLMYKKNEKEPTEDDKGELLVTKEVIKSVAPDVTAQIFWLKNRRSDKWRDKRDVELSGGLKVANADVSKLSDEELRRFIDDGSGDKE